MTAEPTSRSTPATASPVVTTCAAFLHLEARTGDLEAGTEPAWATNVWFSAAPMRLAATATPLARLLPQPNLCLAGCQPGNLWHQPLWQRVCALLDLRGELPVHGQLAHPNRVVQPVLCQRGEGREAHVQLQRNRLHRVYDYNYYVENHPEVTAVVGTGLRRCSRYFVQNDMPCGVRASLNFDPATYKALRGPRRGFMTTGPRTTSTTTYGFYEDRLRSSRGLLSAGPTPADSLHPHLRGQGPSTV